ncbi:hypothetical protein [Bradyrhizobium sp. USDA 377]
MLPGLFKQFAERLPDTYWMLPVALASIVLSISGFLETGFLRGTKGPNRFGPDPLAKTGDSPSPAKNGTSKASSNWCRPALAHPAACMLSGAHDRCSVDCPRSHPLPLGNPGRCRRAGGA